MPFEDKKAREKEERRQEIVDAAQKCFFSRGYDQVTMDDIAKEVGVNKALIYYYFRDKESVYFAVALRGARIFKDMIRAAAAGELTGIKKLRAIGRAYFEFSMNHPEHFKINYDSGSFRFLLSKKDQFSREHMELTAEMSRICVEAAKLGIEDGTIRKGLNPAEIVIFLGHACEGLVKVKYYLFDNSGGIVMGLESVDVGYDQFVEDSLDLLEHALKSDAGGK